MVIHFLKQNSQFQNLTCSEKQSILRPAESEAKLWAYIIKQNMEGLSYCSTLTLFSDRQAYRAQCEAYNVLLGLSTVLTCFTEISRVSNPPPGARRVLISVTAFSTR